MSRPSETRSNVIHCSGARATERRLLAEIDRALGGRRDLARPVRIIVPSKSLRRHLLSRLVRTQGAVAGLTVQTAFSAAREILQNARVAPPSGDAFFDVVVRRLASTEKALSSNLEALDDGYGPVVGVVRDLLDAGFQPGNEEGVLDKLDDLERPVTPQRLERARAIVRIAAKSYEAMSATDCWRSAHVFESAKELLYQRGEELLAASVIFIHGFADLTGVTADFFESLVRTFPTVLLIDRPDRPGDPGTADPGGAFLDRLKGRFDDPDRRVVVDQREPAPDVDLTQGGEIESEMRWVAERARTLIKEGVVPEEIGIVARQFEGLAYPLRRHLLRLGVPFSGIGEMVAAGGCRRAVSGLTEILRSGPKTPVDLWMESWAGGRADLLAAFRTIGVVRIEDVASLRFKGPLGRGVSIPFPGFSGEHGGRTVSADALRDARQYAVSLARVFEEWPDDAGAPSHADCTLRVLSLLGWTPEGEAWKAVVQSVRSLERELEVIPDLESGEWLRLLADRLAAGGDEPIGGAGGGVQVLNVTEARARTFDHLFLVGFNRNIFPRVAGDDSLLPDAIRARLATDVLPELPVRARSADEERYLFAQAVSSARSLHISWHLSARGKATTRSPFVADYLRVGAPDPVAPPLWSTARSDFGPRPPYEHAILEAVSGDRRRLASILAEAVAAGEGAPSSSDASELAEARVDILGQVDPEQATGRPNPWFGFVGGVFPTEEAGPSVTGIERTAECPWAAFVGRRLGVAPTPDPQLGLPDPKGRLVGEVVHRVLEDIVRDTVPHESAGDVREIGSRNTCDVPWPAAARFEEILARNSGEVAAEAGLGPLGMGSLLAARSRPYLAVARDFDWHGGGRLAGVLATEASGVAFFSDTEPPLRFRADRVDRESDGLCLVDYKTGKPVSTLLKVETRRRHLLKEVQKGRMLQAAAYARALPEGEARGRYVWLKPDIGEAPEEAREAVVSGTDTDFMAAAAAAVAAVNSSREAGVVFPRVEEVGSDDIPNHCKYCAVAEACRRDDSGFRRRLVAWMAHAGPVAPPAETAARVLWHLGSPVEGDS